MTAKLIGFEGLVGHMGPQVCGYVAWWVKLVKKLRGLKGSLGSKIFWLGSKFGMDSKFGVSLKFEVGSKSGTGLTGLPKS